MSENQATFSFAPKRKPWNKGKLIGPKPPLRPKHVWGIRTKLQVNGRVRDLALFNLAIDSKLRGCDVVRIWVEDVAPLGYTMDSATVRQKKTGLPVKFELTEHTRQAMPFFVLFKLVVGAVLHGRASSLRSRVGAKGIASRNRTSGKRSSGTSLLDFSIHAAHGRMCSDLKDWIFHFTRPPSAHTISKICWNHPQHDPGKCWVTKIPTLLRRDAGCRRWTCRSVAKHSSVIPA